MLNLNKVTLVGFLGRDPQIRRFANGGIIATLSVATSYRSIAENGGWVEYTDWHRVKLNGRLAEIAESYLHKGEQVYLEGKLKSESWKGADGVQHHWVVVQANHMVLLGRKSARENGYESHEASKKLDWLNQPAPAPFTPAEVAEF